MGDEMNQESEKKYREEFGAYLLDTHRDSDFQERIKYIRNKFPDGNEWTIAENAYIAACEKRQGEIDSTVVIALHDSKYEEQQKEIQKLKEELSQKDDVIFRWSNLFHEKQKELIELKEEAVFYNQLTKRGGNKKEFSRSDIAKGIGKFELEINKLKEELQSRDAEIEKLNNEVLNLNQQVGLYAIDEEKRDKLLEQAKLYFIENEYPSEIEEKWLKEVSELGGVE